MAAPTIPPIRLGLIGTEDVLAGFEPEHRATRSGSDATTHTATTHTTVVRGVDNDYRGELIDFADAVQLGVRLVGRVAQSVANVMVVQRALDSAQRAAVLALDPRSDSAGRPGQRIRSSASFAA
ncbi:hypothetical protein [Kibdelosporangium aridum]|uniref:hypothetical protein n=1 Tax=Kibdelosporangium aridum TaxID=2030 RepID=UPI000559DA52|nr:hypothetical protein [Kibdelosporangium aridum]